MESRGEEEEGQGQEAEGEAESAPGAGSRSDSSRRGTASGANNDISHYRANFQQSQAESVFESKMVPLRMPSSTSASERTRG